MFAPINNTVTCVFERNTKLFTYKAALLCSQNVLQYKMHLTLCRCIPTNVKNDTLCGNLTNVVGVLRDYTSLFFFIFTYRLRFIKRNFKKTALKYDK